MALILAAAMMLDHLGKRNESARIHSAVNSVIESQDRLTRDLGGDASTAGIADALVERLAN